MNYRVTFIAVAVALSSSVFAQQIRDVPMTDPGYTAVNSAVKMGYLP